MKKWLTIAQGAKHANVSKRTLQGWLKQGLRYSKINGTVRLREDWLNSFIEGNEVVDADTIIVRRRLADLEV